MVDKLVDTCGRFANHQYVTADVIPLLLQYVTCAKARKQFRLEMSQESSCLSSRYTPLPEYLRDATKSQHAVIFPRAATRCGSGPRCSCGIRVIAPRPPPR